MTFEEWFRELTDEWGIDATITRSDCKAAWDEAKRQEREVCALIAEADANGTCNESGIIIARAIRDQIG